MLPTSEPESKPNEGGSLISATGPVGLIFTVAILLIFLAGIHPARLLLAASITLCLAAALIRRFNRRG
jgi:hypothetical protein